MVNLRNRCIPKIGRLRGRTTPRQRRLLNWVNGTETNCVIIGRMMSVNLTNPKWQGTPSRTKSRSVTIAFLEGMYSFHFKGVTTSGVPLLEVTRR
jgi:hypothetical protein